MFRDTNINNVNVDIDQEEMMASQQYGAQYGGTGMVPGMGAGMGSCGCPIVEAPMERVVHRCMMHEVPHVCPINTRVINHHVYRHTYQPRYSCCEQNEVVNINQGSCCNFM